MQYTEIHIKASYHWDHHHLPCTSEPWHYHLSPCNALRYSDVSFRYYGHWCYQYPVMLVFHSYHDAILQKYSFELTIILFEKNKDKKKCNTKTKQKTKQISKTNHCQTMDYRTNRQRLWNVEAYNNKLAAFLKSKKHHIVKGMLHNMIYSQHVVRHWMLVDHMMNK